MRGNVRTAPYMCLISLWLQMVSFRSHDPSWKAAIFKMNEIFPELSTTHPAAAPSEQAYVVSQLSPPSSANLQVQSESSGLNLNEKVSPSILLIIIILAIIFFLSGLLHLIVRLLWRPQTRDPDDIESVTALQGQLQQLFHLHDAGVDQSFIDTLPVFQYKAIIGLKNPFDCAVCLCEFEPDDKLRLLPKCSHAFHVECIDTWLLSHSTCPLCRASLLPDFSPNNSRSPILLVLESGSESSREIAPDGEAVLGRTSSVLTANSNLGCHGEHEFGSSRMDLSHKSSDFEVQPTEKHSSNPTGTAGSKEKVVTVKLGKYRNVDGGESGAKNNADPRRCFSMGSFEYIMDENSHLQVPIRTPMKKHSSKKPVLPLAPGHKLAMSECDFESRREFKFQSVDTAKKVPRSVPTSSIVDNNSDGGGAITCNRKESFSISKIWLREKDKSNSEAGSSRRAFSFSFPVQQQPNLMPNNKQHVADAKHEKSESKIDFNKWENGGSEFSYDEEIQSYKSTDSQPRAPSFPRRTLLWLMGRQNRIVNPNSDIIF